MEPQSAKPSTIGTNVPHTTRRYGSRIPRRGDKLQFLDDEQARPSGSPAALPKLERDTALLSFPPKT